MTRFFYSLLLYLLSPLILFNLLVLRGSKEPAFRRRVGERFGFVPSPPQTGGLWVHAVSVGEVIAARPMVRYFLERHPALPVVITTMTLTGSDRVRALFGDAVFHVYAPYDLPGAVGRFLDRIEPVLAVIMETEVWPNMISKTVARGVPVVLANGRMSARSARGYARLGPLTQQIFSGFTRVVAQSRDDARRYRQLGVPEHKLLVSGSIKFDIEIGEPLRQQATDFRRQALGARPVWVAASTHPGEDEPLLQAHRLLLAQQADALLILVPRHPEHFDEVAAILQDEGFVFQRRSSAAPVAASTQVLLGDSMGELLLLYGCGDLAFVGGSLIPRGGHNLLEPAAWGLPVISGPSDFNFAEISRLLTEAGALAQVQGGEDLGTLLGALFVDPPRRVAMGGAAQGVVAANRGALMKLVSGLETLLPQ